MSEELLSGNVEPFPFACRALVHHASMAKKLLHVPGDAMQSRKRHGIEVCVSMYVCVCMVYVCVYMYICMCVCMYVCIYLYVHIYVGMWICRYVCMCVRM